jgi:transketolase C-terminal domain/subunit
MGLIEAIKFVRKEDIKAEVVTAGTIKPMVYL